MLPATLTSLLVAFTNILSINRVDKPSLPTLQFQLRHLHAVSDSAHVIFSDVQPRTLDAQSNNLGSSSEPYTIQTRQLPSFRPQSFEAFSNARIRSMRFGQSEQLQWDEEEILGPDVEKRDTLLQLAKMTNNAYLTPGEAGWYDLGGGWNTSYPFGWEPDADGFRGHVFATPDNKTVVLSIKGTSAGVFGGGGPTVKKDRVNDNLLFSCCCARVDWTWTTECYSWEFGDFPPPKARRQNLDRDRLNETHGGCGG
ncbi:hypothetical protein H0H87_004784 [Tephrocybe sp. NHM501043]|nr:hypothetical protein H0H87_004784 [Tephrocybe sp. NHM501043]